MGKRRGGGLQKATRALATADAVAHIAFLGLFGYRIFSKGPIGKIVSAFCALVALAGLVLGVLGWMLVKHGGRTRVRTLGLWGVGASTALAGTLLVMASWLGD